MKMYVACLASYNNGALHGTWIDLDDKTVDDIQNEINAMLASSPVNGAEEYAVHYYDSFPDMGEYPSLADVVETAELINEYDDAAYAALDNYHDVDSAKQALEDRYCGRFSHVNEYAEQLFDECYAHNMPENLRCYIDYDKFARDLELGGDIDAVEHGGYVYIFSSN